ncbi:MAG: LamG-like jellyroll fold domain-containing protein [bacterium]
MNIALIPNTYVEIYAEEKVASLLDVMLLEERQMATSSKSSILGGMTMMRMAGSDTNIVVAKIEVGGTGTLLRVDYPDTLTNRLEVMVSTNLLDRHWWVVATNLVTAGTNSLEWVDTSATNGPSDGKKFYWIGNSVDSDGDGVADGREAIIYHTNPDSIDSDNDGLVDGFSGKVLTNTYPAGVATNGCFYVEGEMSWGTDPAKFDTDSDGMGDGWEVAHQHNPLDPNDPPNVSGTVVYSGRQTGTVWVIAVTSSNSWSTSHCSTSSPSASPNTFSYLIPDLEQTNYWVKAWLDSNLNGNTNTIEARGILTNIAITVTNRVTAQDFALVDPDDDGDGLPDWWEIAHFGSTTNTTGGIDVDGDEYTNQEEYEADTDPANISSHPWDLSGTIIYTGPQTGVIHVVACTNGTDWAWGHADTLTNPGPYTITHLPPNTHYWVRAWRDSNQDSLPTSWEACGSHNSNPVFLDANRTGQDITLTDPDADGDGISDWWEILYGLDPARGGGDGLAAWWKLDEGVGTNILDATATANHGVLMNGSNAWVTGIISNGLALNGTTGYVEVPDSVSLKPGNVSVGLWIKPGRLYTNGMAMFLSKRVPNGAAGYSLGYETGAVAFAVAASGVKSLRYACALTADVPIHVVGTFGSTAQSLYINGTRVATTNYDWGLGFGTISQDTNVLRLGAASGATQTNCFAGLLDDVRVYPGEWTTNQVRAMWEQGVDPDQDGLSNAEEYKHGTNPTNSDSDADGMLDGWEVKYGLNPLSAADATEDKDGDGYLNIYETKWNTDPASLSSYPLPTIIVTNGVSTIQGAVNSVTQDYAVVLVKAGIYTNSGNWDINYGGKKLMLVSETGNSNTVIDCQAAGAYHRGFFFNNMETRASVLRGFTIRNANAFSLAGPGGGIACSNASPTIANCVLERNDAYYGGGAAFFAGSQARLINCRIVSNHYAYAGSGIAVLGSSPEFTDCLFAWNNIVAQSGLYTPFGCGVYIAGGSPVFSNCVSANNYGQDSAGVYWGSQYSGGWQTSEVGGKWIGGQIVSNQALGWYGSCAGLDVNGSVIVSNTIIAFNHADGLAASSGYPDMGSGAGLACGGGVEIVGCSIYSNVLEGGLGGGIFLSPGTNASPLLVDCAIYGNKVATRGFGGGVVINNSSVNGDKQPVIIQRCRITGNGSPMDGGGLYLGGGGYFYCGPITANVQNTYLAGNTAGRFGGAVYSSDSSPSLVLQNCTIVSNAALMGGGLHVSQSSNTIVRNTILWGNSGSQIGVVSGTVVVVSDCVQGGFAGGTAVITNNPRLFAGYRLISQDSPCVDAGTTNGLSEEDLSGKPRLSGIAPDIGCDEFVMIDTDTDGMFDDWENWFFHSLSRDGTGDYDMDRVTDAQEYAQWTDPTSNVDTDHDSLSDDYEIHIGTDPGYWDSDGDGMSDGWEDKYGLNPLSPNDPNIDSDNDGWTDGQEADQGTDPQHEDTDGDEVPDSIDVDPLDPGNSDVATPENSCNVTLMVGDSSGSHTELYGMQLGSYRLFMSHVNESEFIFTKTIRLPRGNTYEGYIEALGDSDNDGDYDADVTSEEPGFSVIDPSGYLGGHHEDTGFNSGRRYFHISLGSTAANTNTAANADPGKGCTKDPINTQNGNVTLSETDIVIPCPGFSLSFGRDYNSRAAVTNGILGPCWAHSYEMFLQSRSNTMYKGTSGNWRMLSLPQGQEFWFQDNGNGTYKNPKDSNLRLGLAGSGWAITQAGEAQWAFDTNGVLNGIMDAFSNRVTLTYTGAFPNHKLSRVEHLNGQFLAFSYTGASLTRIDTPVASLSVQFGYNSNNELAYSIRNAGGASYTNCYFYDVGTHSLIQRVNAAGDMFNYDYGYTTNAGHVISRGISMALAPDYYQHSVNYTNRGSNATEVTYTRNGTAQMYVYKYDPVINMIKAQLGPGGTNLGVRYGINGNQDVTQVTQFDDSLGEYAKILRSYDTNHNVTFTGFAHNASTTTNWTGLTWNNNLLASVKDAEGVRVDFEYTNGLVNAEKAYIDSNQYFATRYTYTGNGLISAVTNANGHWQGFAYDSYGFMTSAVPQLGPSACLEYNRMGFVTNIVTPWSSGSRATRIGVNELGWSTNVVYPNGLVETFKYDSLGNLTNHVDTAGRTNRLTWLPTGKPASVSRWLDGVSPTNVTIYFAYDNQFNTMKITDPMGRAVESYKLDIQDRPIAVTNLEGRVMSINWGLGNYIRSLMRFDGSVVSNSYNTDGLLTQVTGPSFTNGYTYYRNGALKTVANGDSTVANTFDPAGRLTAQQMTAGASTNTVAYQFDPVGNVTNIAVSNTLVRSGWTYDAAERPLMLTAQAAPNRVSVFQWTYNTNNGLVASVTNAAITESMGYDILDRATNIMWKTASGTTNRSFGYAFNAAGMITNMSRENGGWTAYTYDSLDRLLSEKQYASTGLTYSAAWTYDLAGNRTRAITNNVTNLYSYAAGNILTNFGSGTLVQHDLAGNITNLQYNTSKKLSLYWNGRYELIEARSNGVTVEKYDYDALGRRARIIAGAVTNTFVYSGPHVVAEWSNNVLARSYSHGPGVDNFLSMTTYGAATNTYFYLKDALGSVHALVNTNGAVVEQYKYTAWGEVTVLSSNGTVLAASAYGNRFTFQGREASYSAGLLFFRSRYYSAALGRWLSKDRIGISGGHNLYEAFGSDPINFTDAFGLRMRLLGTPEEQSSLLSILQQFIRGQLGMGEGGGVYRQRCSKDEKYDDMISDILASKNDYVIMLVESAGTGGGSFKPNGSGGTIKLDRVVADTYLGAKGWLPQPGQKETQASILAHELARAYAHSQNERYTQYDHFALSADAVHELGLKAVDRSNPMRERMGMLPRWGYEQ